MIEMRARDVDACCAGERDQIRFARVRAAPPPIAPVTMIAIPPSAVAEMHHALAMRTPAMLTAAFGATEPDDFR